MNQILALTAKDLRLLLRDKTGFFFTFFFPLIYCIFFGVVFSSIGRGGGNKIPIVIVDDDNTSESAKFIEQLRAGSELNVTTAPLAAAQDSVRKGNQTAYLVLPKGFGESRDHMLWGPVKELELGIDPSRQAEAGLLQGVLAKAMFQGMQDMFTNTEKFSEHVQDWSQQVRASNDMDPTQKAALLVFFPALDSFMKMMPKNGTDGEAGAGSGAWNPVPIKTVSVVRQREGPENSYAITFPQGIIWGVMGCAAGFGISMVVERTSGTLVRLRTAPIRPAQILAGKAGACGLTTLALSTMLLLIARVVFGVRPVSIPLLAFALVCIAICFVGIMMLLSVLGKTEQAAGGIGWAILVVMSMIGGGMIPLMFLPPFMLPLSHLSPVKWSIVAMEGAIWRGFTFSEMLKPCGILVGIGLVCFLIGTRAFKWGETR